MPGSGPDAPVLRVLGASLRRLLRFLASSMLIPELGEFFLAGKVMGRGCYDSMARGKDKGHVPAGVSGFWKPYFNISELATNPPSAVCRWKNASCWGPRRIKSRARRDRGAICENKNRAPPCHAGSAGILAGEFIPPATSLRRRDARQTPGS